MKKKTLKASVVTVMIAASLLANPTISFANSTIQETIDKAKMDMKNAAYAYVKPAEDGRIVSSQELYQLLNLAKKNYENARNLVITSDLPNKEAVLKELDTLYNERLTKGLIPYIDAFNYVDKYLNPIMAEIKQAESEKNWSELEKAYHKLSVQLNTRTVILYRFTGKASRDLLLEQYKKPADFKRDQLIVPVTIYMQVKEAETLLALGKTEQARKILEDLLPLLESLPSANAFPMIVELMKEVDSAREEAGLILSIPTPPPSPTNSESSADDRASANRAAARAVTTLINALPAAADVNVGSGVAINAARAAYEKLTTAQKAMVDITRLTDAEKAFEIVRDKAVNEQAAKVVEYLIACLPAAAAVTVGDEEQIEEARTEYEGLKDEQKILVSNIRLLEEAEQALVSAKEIAASEQAIEMVRALIAALPVTVTVEDESQIEAARAAYEALAEDQQAMVNITALEKAEKALEDAKIKAAAEDKKKAQEVVKLIDAIKKTSTAAKYKAALEDAQEAYGKLTVTQKALVTNFENLEKELADFAEVEAEASKLTAQAIGVLVNRDNLLKKASALLDAEYKVSILSSQPGMLNGNLIIQPEAGEEAISGVVNFQVTSGNGTKIERPVELTIEPVDLSKLAIDAVKALIAALPAASDVKLSHKAKIQAARAAYEELSEEQQLAVDITPLTNAEKAIEALETDAENKAKANEVIKLINAINKNNKKYIEALEAAKEAFYSLTEMQQALVTNSQKLMDELADFAAIEAEASKVTTEAIGVLVDGDNLVNRVTALLEPGYTVTITAFPAGMLKGKQTIVQPKAGAEAIAGDVTFQLVSTNGTKIECSAYLTVEPK